MRPGTPRPRLKPATVTVLDSGGIAQRRVTATPHGPEEPGHFRPSLFLYDRLERQLETHLHRTIRSGAHRRIIVGHIRSLTGKPEGAPVGKWRVIPGIECRIRVLRVVEQIENLPPELAAKTLGEFPVLNDGGIPELQSISAERVARHGPVLP